MAQLQRVVVRAMGNHQRPGDDFEALIAKIEPILRRAFVAAFGFEDGRDATAEALAYGWEHRERIVAMDNPAGYLFRVGQSGHRRRRDGFLPARDAHDAPVVEPELMGALKSLTPQQRVAVVLTEAYGWTLSEVAEFMGRKKSTVQRHRERGLSKLRKRLGS
jgi:DNA-directed RNA polymerase specialized sigma24 family protein